MSSEAAAERVSLLTFEGDSARSLRWRVAAALKRAGHTVMGYAPPKDPDDLDQLRAYARRRKVDLFIGGSSAGGRDGWELTLTLKNADGETLGKGVTFNAGSRREMISEIKENGDRIDRAIAGAPAAGGDGEGSAADFAGNARARAKRKGKASAPSRSRDVEEPLNLDDDTASEDEAGGAAASEDAESMDADDAAEKPARSARAKGWANASESSASSDDSSDTTSEASTEDDGRASFLSGDSSESGEDAGTESSEAAAVSDDPTVLMGLNAGFVRRTLGYADDLYGRLRAPSVNAWVYRLQAAVYPFARPVKNRIGLIAGYESAFSGVVRDDNAGTDFGVTFSEIYGGLQLRQPLGKHEIALEGTVGSMQSGLDDPDGLSGVPEFSYTSLRAAFDVGLRFGGLSLRGALGYRLPIGGYGEASEAEWFPRMEGYGMEGSAGLAYQISREVAFEVSGSARRFLLQMNSQPSDALEGTAEVAGGAADLYLGGYFGLNIRL